MLIVFLILAIGCMNATVFGAEDPEELIKTIATTDASGHESTELAFRSPARGVPGHVIEMYCANIKLRLYWGVYRETIKDKAKRTGQDVRRLSRLARHYYPEIRAVDTPFGAPKLSRIDSFLPARDLPEEDEPNSDDDIDLPAESTVSRKEQQDTRSPMKKIQKNFQRLKLSKSRRHHGEDEQDQDEEEDTEIKQMMDATLNAEGSDDEAEAGTGQSTSTQAATTSKVKKTKLERMGDYVKKYAPKVGMGVYTRWSTMWWLMMSCLFTKYYLWDPALDEFIKLKKTMIMYPDMLTMKLQDINCLPTKFFQRIISTCKILNPLLKYSFGQLSLDNMMRFKGRAD